MIINSPQNFNLEYQAIHFLTEDRYQISGWYIPQPKSQKLIIICHGYHSHKGNVIETTCFLHKDYHLLYFDFRGHGESQKSHISIGYHEPKDLKAAVAWSQQQGFAHIGVFAISMGASIALMTPQLPIQALIVDSPFASLDDMMQYDLRKPKFLKFFKLFWIRKLYFKRFGILPQEITPLKGIPHITCPTFIMHGEKDERTPWSQFQKIISAYPKFESWSIPNATHCEGKELYPEEFQQKVFAFYQKHLK